MPHRDDLQLETIGVMLFYLIARWGFFIPDLHILWPTKLNAAHMSSCGPSSQVKKMGAEWIVQAAKTREVWLVCCWWVVFSAVDHKLVGRTVLTIWKLLVEWNSHCIISKNIGMVAFLSSVSGISVISNMGPTISGMNLILCWPVKRNKNSWI